MYVRKRKKETTSSGDGFATQNTMANKNTSLSMSQFVSNYENKASRPTVARADPFPSQNRGNYSGHHLDGQRYNASSRDAQHPSHYLGGQTYSQDNMQTYNKNAFSQDNRQAYPQSNRQAYPQSNRQAYPQDNRQTYPQENRQVYPQDNRQAYPQDNRQAYPQDNRQAYPQSNRQAYPQDNRQTYPQDNRQAYPQDNRQAYPQDNRQAYPQNNRQAYPQNNRQAYPQDNRQAYPQDNRQAYPQVNRQTYRQDSIQTHNQGNTSLFDYQHTGRGNYNHNDRNSNSSNSYGGMNRHVQKKDSFVTQSFSQRPSYGGNDGNSPFSNQHSQRQDIPISNLGPNTGAQAMRNEGRDRREYGHFPEDEFGKNPLLVQQRQSAFGMDRQGGSQSLDNNLKNDQFSYQGERNYQASRSQGKDQWKSSPFLSNRSDNHDVSGREKKSMKDEVSASEKVAAMEILNSLLKKKKEQKELHTAIEKEAPTQRKTTRWADVKKVNPSMPSRSEMVEDEPLSYESWRRSDIKNSGDSPDLSQMRLSKGGDQLSHDLNQPMPSSSRFRDYQVLQGWNNGIMHSDMYPQMVIHSIEEPPTLITDGIIPALMSNPITGSLQRRSGQGQRQRAYLAELKSKKQASSVFERLGASKQEGTLPAQSKWTRSRGKQASDILQRLGAASKQEGTRPARRKRGRGKKKASNILQRLGAPSVKSRLGPKNNTKTIPIELRLGEAPKENDEKSLKNMIMAKQVLLNKLCRNAKISVSFLQCKACNKTKFVSPNRFLYHMYGNPKTELGRTHTDLSKSYLSKLEAVSALALATGELDYRKHFPDYEERENTTICSTCTLPGRKHEKIKGSKIFHNLISSRKCCQSREVRKLADYLTHTENVTHIVKEAKREKVNKANYERARKRLEDCYKPYRNGIKTSITKAVKSFKQDFVGCNIALRADLYEVCGKDPLPSRLNGFLKWYEINDVPQLDLSKTTPSDTKLIHYDPSCSYGKDLIALEPEILWCNPCSKFIGSLKEIIGNPKEIMLEHCSSKEHYDNLVLLKQKRQEKREERLKLLQQEMTEIKEKHQENVETEDKEREASSTGDDANGGDADMVDLQQLYDGDDSNDLIYGEDAMVKEGEDKEEVKDDPDCEKAPSGAGDEDDAESPEDGNVENEEEVVSNEEGDGEEDDNEDGEGISLDDEGAKEMHDDDDDDEEVCLDDEDGTVEEGHDEGEGDGIDDVEGDKIDSDNEEVCLDDEDGSVEEGHDEGEGDGIDNVEGEGDEIDGDNEDMECIDGDNGSGEGDEIGSDEEDIEYIDDEEGNEME